MRALDLFCCAGGAGMGLHRAGFEVTGVDIAPQLRYPFAFIQGDALAQDLTGFDFVWASPPCQAHTAMKTMHNAKVHADLIPATRAKLEAWGGHWIMENVVGAPLRNPAILCGTMFGLGSGDAELRRHRLFECSFPVLSPQCAHGSRPESIGIYGGHIRNRKRRTAGANAGVADFSADRGREAMGIDWMTTAELCQSIPPAYSEFLGKQALAVIQATRPPDRKGAE